MPARSKQARIRSWCWTLNNFTEEQYEAIKLFSQDATKVQYSVIGKEVGANGTPHLQGFIHFVNGKTFDVVKKILMGAHVEPRRGTPEQASTYCCKEGASYEAGSIPASLKARSEQQKQRWQDILHLARTGDMYGIQESYPDVYIRYRSTLYNIRKDNALRPKDLGYNPNTRNRWYWGPAGVGKSRRARYENLDYYAKNQNKWWDAYHNEDTVIIDDFDRSTAKYLSTHLKVWSDRYAFIGEIKGSARWMRPKKIIVTSNYHPRELWNDDSELRDAIMRRFTFEHMTSPWNPPIIAVQLGIVREQREDSNCLSLICETTPRSEAT